MGGDAFVLELLLVLNDDDAIAVPEVKGSLA
jgi:hypothetical protein